MAVNYAAKYSQQVDERFKLGALTSSLVNYAFEWLGVSTVKVYSMPTAAMGDYTTEGASRYGTPEELGNEVQEMTLAKDRAFTFTIDKKSEDDTMGTMEAGAALRRQIDEVVIPEIDTYRIAKLVAGADAGNIVKDTAVTKANAYEKFLAVQEILDNKKVPTGGRICICTPGYYNMLKLDEAFTKKGDMATQIAINGLVGEVDGVYFVKAPKSYILLSLIRLLCRHRSNLQSTRFTMMRLVFLDTLLRDVSAMMHSYSTRRKMRSVYVKIRQSRSDT